MGPIYVSAVFRVLRLLGIPQQSVASYLGVSQTRVSLWANDDLEKVEPIAKRHSKPFLRFAREQLRSGFIGAPASKQQQLWDAVEAWAEEYAEQSGANNAEIARWKDVIANSRRIAPEKETPEDALKSYYAAKALMLAYRHKSRHAGFHEEIDALDGIKRWGSSHAPDEDIIARFEAIAGYWGVVLDETDK
jgi:transcriptional regulator with XRE-family HTH domain